MKLLSHKAIAPPAPVWMHEYTISLSDSEKRDLIAILKSGRSNVTPCSTENYLVVTQLLGMLGTI